MSKPLVSVIVPVYNVEDYLGQCLESIISQSYENLEIVCINDGTPDASEAIIDQYVMRDSRVKKINQKNKGLNLARETGFNNSNGDFVTFVDSDDLIHPKMIEVAVQNAMDTSSEVTIFGFKEFKKSVSEIRPSLSNQVKLLTNKEQIFKYLLVNDLDYIDRTLQLTVWGKLYKRNIVKKIDWKKSNYRQHEDLFWTPHAFNEVTRSICLNRSEFYFYRRDPSRDVLSRAFTGNTFNGTPVGYLEIVQKFSVLVDELLSKAQLKSKLRREFEDVIYGMYRGHLADLIRNNAIKTENNIEYIPDYFRYSEKHIGNLISSLKNQDHHIKEQNNHIEALSSKLTDLDNKLNSNRLLLSAVLTNFKRKTARIYKKLLKP